MERRPCAPSTALLDSSSSTAVRCKPGGCSCCIALRVPPAGPSLSEVLAVRAIFPLAFAHTIGDGSVGFEPPNGNLHYGFVSHSRCDEDFLGLGTALGL